MMICYLYQADDYTLKSKIYHSTKDVNPADILERKSYLGKNNSPSKLMKYLLIYHKAEWILIYDS